MLAFTKTEDEEKLSFFIDLSDACIQQDCCTSDCSCYLAIVLTIHECTGQFCRLPLSQLPLLQVWLVNLICATGGASYGDL